MFLASRKLAICYPLANINMLRRISILCFVLSVATLCMGQDTIKVEPSIYYSNEEVHKLSGKGFGGNYAREDIYFSAEHLKQEYCYYQDSIRQVHTRDVFNVLNDSLLRVGDSVRVEFVWTYKELSKGNYLIYRQDSNYYEFGEVTSLVPLKHVTPTYTTTKNKQDTLWTTNYDYPTPWYPNGHLNYKLYDSKITGRVYEYYQIDTQPMLLNGDSLPEITIKWIDGSFCYCMPRGDIAAMSLIITKDGEIKNIEQALGNVDEGCPNTIKEIIREIADWGLVTPAQKKWKKM